MQDVQFYRKLLFKTCESKEDLQRWTRIFLKVDLPDCIVSEESNSSPADLVWEIYSKSKDNNDEKFARVMAYASRGSFKCQVKGSKLLDKDKGAVCIENVKVGDVIWSGWNWRKVTNWIHDGIKASKKLTLQDGTVLEGSPIHRYWAWGPNGVPGWKRSDELTTNDYIMADVSHKYGDQPIVQEEFDKGYLCGILQGDGGLSFMDRLGMVSLTGMSGPSVDFWLDFCAKNGYHVRAKKQFEHSKATTYTVYSKSKLVPFLKSLGLKNSRSWEKEIPSFAWTSKSAMAGFVTGLFDTDGSINKSKNAVLFQLTATKLLQELPILLRALGVNSQLHHLKLGKLNKHPVSIVSIGMHETIKLLKSGVKLVKGSKKNEFNALYDPQKKNIDDSISKSMLASLLAKLPTQGGRWRKAKMFKPRIGYDNISRAKCKDLVKYAEVNGLLEQKDIDYWSAVFENKWVRVSKIEDGQADFYDLTVETDHSYWSNGFISHNTLGASILEILTIFHLDRNVGHMAATGDQSERSQEYVRDFLNMPYLIDFKVGDSKKRIEIIRFTDSKTGNIYTEEEYKALTPDIKTRCSRKSSWIKIVICSLAGANGLHAEFFCVDGETDVKTDFNNTIKAKDIKIGTEILSYNFDTGALEKLPVVNLVKTNKKALKIRSTDGEIITSEDHPFYIEGKGFVQAGQLNVGDKTTHPGRYFAQKSPPKKPLETKPINGTVIEQVADEWEQVLLGSLLGDMGIYKKTKNNPYLLESHGLAQKAYMDWKWSIISRKLRSTKVNATSGYTGKPIVGMRSGNSALLLPYVNTRTTLEGIERLGPQGLAIWYMDDGCSGRGFRLSTEGWGLEINEQIVKFLDQKFSIKTKVHKYVRNGKTYYNIQGSAQAKERLVEICKPYIHPDLAYKFTLTDLNSICKKCNKTFLAKQRNVTGRKSKVCFNSECQMFGRQTFKTGTILSIEKLPEQELYDFTLPRNHNFIGNNFLTHQCTDELDTVPADKIRGYRESKNIPKARDGKMPITLLTSTRKFSTGLVQKELDMSHKNGLHVRHWNVIDVTEKCLPERHKPEEPKVPLYINDDTLDVLTAEKYSELEPALQKKYEVTQAFAGCLKCPLFAGCKTRLATHQTSTSTMLSPIGEIASKFLDQPVEDVQTQLLCFAPQAEVLMANGTFKAINTVQVGDKVITHTGAVKNVTEVLSRDFKGRALSFNLPTKKGFGPTICSPEHPFFVNGKEFVDAVDIKPWKWARKGGPLTQAGDYFSFPGNYEKSGISEIKISDFVDKIEVLDGKIRSKSGQRQGQWMPNVWKLDYDFGWILGWYLAEGFTAYRTYSKKVGAVPYSVTFACDDREIEYHKKVREFGRRCGLVAQEQKTKASQHGYTQRFYSRLLVLMFEELGGHLCDKKVLREDLLGGPVDFLKGILEGFDAGDGTKRHSSEKELTTTSKQLSEQLFLIAARMGTNPRIKKLKKNKRTKKQAYRIWYQNKAYINKNKRTKFKFENDYNQYRFDYGADSVYYDGKLWNLEVEDDHSYIVDGVAVHNCRKASSHGLVYSKLNKDIHQKTATQMAEMIIGEPLKIKVSKDTLLKFLKEKGAVFYTGIDFGFSHNFAVVTGAMYGRNFYVLDAFERQHLDLEEKIAICQRLKVLNTTIFPDMANPDDIKAFRKNGFMIRAWDKNAGSVKSGIEICRSRIRPAFGKPTLFFLKDDDGCESLLNKLMKYSFEVDQTGEVIDVPMKTDDDFCFTEPTEVLTNSGWKKIKDVKDTDQIMAVTPEGTGLFEKPTKIISKHYKGKGHSIKHSHLEFVATSDHKHSVMTQTDWKINNKFNLKKMTVDEMHSEMYWANNIKEWPVGPGLFKQGDDEAWMAGFWLAEGCFDAGRSTFLCFDQTKKQNQEEFRKRAKALNWTFSETIKEWSKTQKSNSIRFVCSGQGERVQKWKTMFKSGAQNKQLTIEQIMLMTESERKNLWEGYMAGDGCRINSAWHYDSISKKLIDGIQVLTLSLGYGCRVIDSYDCFKPGREHIIRGTVCKNIKQIYRGHVLRKQPVAHIQKKRFETVELDESVYCVRTSTGSFLARTNGKVFVAGNCDAFRYLIMNVYNPKGQVVAALDSMDGLGMGLGDGEFLPALEPAQREMQTIINNLADNVSMDDYEDEEDVQRVKKSSKIVWEF